MSVAVRTPCRLNVSNRIEAPAVRRPLRGPGRVERWLAAVTAIALLTMMVVLGAAVMVVGPLAAGEADVSRGVTWESDDSLLGVTRAVTMLGATEVAIPLAVVVSAGLMLVGAWRSACGVLVPAAAAQPVYQLVKDLVDRPRPEANESLLHATGSSFPSGHATLSAAVFGSLAILAVERFEGPRRILSVTAMMVIVLAVGVSRVLLGAHYPSDVVGGWLLGAALALLGWQLAKR
jgi:undecaprenyl-diphosphatase